jgi:hypothetical protein
VPRGRLHALVGPPAAAPFDQLGADALDRGQPAARLLRTVATPLARRAWDAILEDRAAAALYDAPALALGEVFAAIAQVSHRRDLEAMRLDEAAEPAYPPELLEPPGASGPLSVGGHITYVVWMGPAEAQAARAALISAISLPVGAFPTKEPTLWRDLAEALIPVLEAAARARHSLVATRGQ